jgi:hypothetical protein
MTLSITELLSAQRFLTVMFYYVSFMLCRKGLSAILPSVIMLNVVVLSAAKKPFMPRVIILNVVVLSAA